MLKADNPWKEVCERKLPLVFRMLYRRIYRSLNWQREYEALDGELRQVHPDAASGNRIADRFIKSFDKRTGDPRYFHMEVQGKPEKGFDRRVHIGNRRCEERVDSHVASLVVLTDTNAKWRPDHYVSGLYPIQRRAKPQSSEQPVPDAPAAVEKSEESRKRRRRWRQRYHDEKTTHFLVVKLIDFRGREAQLEADKNPMGLFLVAHLEAIRTKRDPKERAKVKLRLLKNLRARKMDAEDVRFWETCFDWFLWLRKERNQPIWEELERQDKEQSMPFVSYAENRGREKGLEEGTKQALRSYLKVKFPEEAPALLPLLDQASGSAADLERLCDLIYLASTPAELRSRLTAPSGAPPAQP